MSAVGTLVAGALPKRRLPLEDSLVALLFALTVALPLAEILLRATLRIGIEGVGALVQHVTLALGMFGAAIAARDGRLLTLAVSGFIHGKAARVAQFAGRLVAGAVSLLLFFATFDFIAAERESRSALVYGIPVWTMEMPLVIGFALMAFRLLWQSADKLKARAWAIAIAVALVGWLRFAPPDPEAIAGPALIVLAAGAFLGAPIFSLIGGAALFLLAARGVPAASIAVDHYSLVVNPALPAVPMFTLAGYVLAESGAPRRLIEVFDAFFGRFRGGAAVATVLVCTFFTSFTGASGVTVLALGGLALPLLLASGYPERPALGLVTAAGLPGTLLIPALPLILYAIVAGIPIEHMFLAGLLPTLLMAGIVISWGMWQVRGASHIAPRFDAGRAHAALLAAKWELAVPIVPIAALASGLATPVESAALTALYVLVVACLVRKDLSLARDVPRVMAECGLIIGGILLIMGVALGLTDYLVDAEIPGRLAAWAKAEIGNRYTMLLALNAALLLCGCFIEIYPAILVLAPIVIHVGSAFGISPVHLGIVFLANMELGYLTPLVGLNLFFASYRFGKPVMELFRAVLPLFAALAVGVLVITYVPWLSTGLVLLLSK